MPSRRTIARLTGAAYVLMLPGGMVGFLYVRPTLVDPGSATTTLVNVIAHQELARVGLLAMLVVIVAQALAALGFYALFREKHPVAALGISAFGLINAAAIVAGTAASWAALELASQAEPASTEAAHAVQALYLLENHAWKIGSVFFGLWLIPMGFAALRSGFFHAGKVLGAILMVGGAAYVLSAFVALLPGAGTAGDLLTLPATVGELWMMFALLVVGVREAAASPTA